MDQSETPLLFCMETNQRRSCSRVPQSSSLPGRHSQKSPGVETERILACTYYAAHAAGPVKLLARKPNLLKRHLPQLLYQVEMKESQKI